jgi:formate/nitrite transporter FocA (FNT family)
VSSDDEPERRHAENTMNRALDQAQSGAPAGGEATRDRFSASEVFQRIVASAEEEVESSHVELVASGIAAGFAITITFLGYTVVSTLVGDSSGLATLVSPLLYPVGFIIIVLGHYQLYTENTLPPVTLVLTRLASLPSLLRVWGLVILGNFVGVGIGAFVLANTAIFSPAEAAMAETFATEALHASWWSVFFKGLFAGWLVAGLVWLDHASRDTTARLLLTYVVIYMIPTADLFHIITSMGDAMYVVFHSGAAIWPLAWEFLLPVFLGNTVGGAVLVALLNYAHTDVHVAFEDPAAHQRQLSLGEWLVGGAAGRSRVTFDEED